MKIKTLISLLLAVLVLFSSTATVYAYTADYSEKFYYTGPYYGSPYFAYLYSPFRNSSGSELYPGITSKYNNPRSMTSSPHGGVDFSAVVDTPVYPLSSGQVVYVHKDAIDPTYGYYVIIRLDVNRDNTLDNAYARYAHLNEIYVNMDDKINTGTQIGLSGSTATPAPHLHVDMRDNNSSPTGVTHSLPWHLYYNNRSNWNYGKDLDWLSQHSITNRRTFAVYCYGKTDGSQNITPSEVKLWIRRAYTSDAWTGYVMSHAGSDQYTVTVPSADFPDGTTVEYLFSGKRGDVSESSYCPYGLYPAKFKAPAIPLDSIKTFARYSHVL